MNKTDEQILMSLARVTHRTRAVLCALAQRGKALRQEHPVQAQGLLSLAATHPIYRSGRLVFDMAEVEEAMQEGPPPHSLDDALLSKLLRPVVASLKDTAEELLASQAEADAVSGFLLDLGTWAWTGRTIWPQLSRSDPLYDLLVLGVAGELLRRRVAPPAAVEVAPRPRTASVA